MHKSQDLLQWKLGLGLCLEAASAILVLATARVC
ncbi:hypothetical protein AWB67_06812 [Caballeronia terrestris]|uniref:Uncharacterized protein n=1 Tax=Caballeronia terrestris TaxID=1226301 RepID=A0A158KV37_9BURK|nr:hypothetical protein AWB67_06812 [Caballeronia terrestris]